MTLSAALRDHRAVRSGGDGGLGDALPDPPAEEASPVAVDLPSRPQNQGVPSVRTQGSVPDVIKSIIFGSLTELE